MIWSVIPSGSPRPLTTDIEEVDLERTKALLEKAVKFREERLLQNLNRRLKKSFPGFRSSGAPLLVDFESYVSERVKEKEKEMSFEIRRLQTEFLKRKGMWQNSSSFGSELFSQISLDTEGLEALEKEWMRQKRCLDVKMKEISDTFLQSGE
jgi:hypothetical protein